LLSNAAIGHEDGMKLRSIQILRGLAALLVVFYHIRAQEFRGIAANGGSETSWLTGVVTNGYAGVDLFFVISGFIMVYVTDGLPHGMKTSADFLFARLTRVYPIWWFFASIMAVYLVGFHSLSGLGEGWQSFARSEPVVPYIIKSFLLLPQAEDPILGVGWTLVHEVYFYLVFTLILLVRRSLLPFLLLAWGLAVIAGSAAGLSGPRPVDFAALVFFPMTMEFILGAATALILTSGIAWRSGTITLVAALAFVGALCVQGVETEHTLQWGRVALYGIPSALLLYGVASLDLTDRLLWLVPAGIGCLAAITVYQLYGYVDDTPFSLRSGGTIVAITVGALATLATLWSGWLGGQAAPDAMRALAPRFRRLMRWLVALGDSSYSLYLSHTIVIVALRLAFGMLGKVAPVAFLFELGHPGVLDNMVFTIVCVPACIAVSLISYRFIERPMVRAFRVWRGKLFKQRACTA
jgi:peptidoglycan/LPS O-acetylase OafA/YrhL